jgi:hypothetical protein
MFALSTDGGATWPAGNIRTVDSAGDVGDVTSIAISGSEVYISYYDTTNQDLKLARSSDGGVTWPAGDIQTVDSAGDVGYDTSIALDGSKVYISYTDWTYGDLKLAQSTDEGATWLELRGEASREISNPDRSFKPSRLLEQGHR